MTTRSHLWLMIVAVRCGACVFSRARHTLRGLKTLSAATLGRLKQTPPLPNPALT